MWVIRILIIHVNHEIPWILTTITLIKSLMDMTSTDAPFCFNPQALADAERYQRDQAEVRNQRVWWRDESSGQDDIWWYDDMYIYIHTIW